jgi:hypothetical protein
LGEIKYTQHLLYRFPSHKGENDAEGRIGWRRKVVGE